MIDVKLNNMETINNYSLSSTALRVSATVLLWYNKINLFIVTIMHSMSVLNAHINVFLRC